MRQSAFAEALQTLTVPGNVRAELSRAERSLRDQVPHKTIVDLTRWGNDKLKYDPKAILADFAERRQLPDVHKLYQDAERSLATLYNIGAEVANKLRIPNLHLHLVSLFKDMHPPVPPEFSTTDRTGREDYRSQLHAKYKVGESTFCAVREALAKGAERTSSSVVGGIIGLVTGRNESALAARYYLNIMTTAVSHEQVCFNARNFHPIDFAESINKLKERFID